MEMLLPFETFRVENSISFRFILNRLVLNESELVMICPDSSDNRLVSESM